MLGRDFVQSRLGSDGTGISYAEFSYSLIQAYDFCIYFANTASPYKSLRPINGVIQWRELI